MKLPSRSPITLGYGATTDPYTPATPHNGIDFAYLPDNTIYAPCDGLVSLIPNNGNDGNGIYMHDPEGRFHGMLHTSKYLVGNGDAVKEGQPIAVMGQTGYAFGVHLHWCVKVNNQFIDPMSLITKGDEMVTEAIATIAWAGFMDMPAKGDGYDGFKGYWVGKPTQDMLQWLIETDRHKDVVTKAREYTDPTAAQSTLDAIKQLVK